MKLLIVGSAASGALEKYYLKHLTRPGVEARIFDCQTPFYQYYNRGVANKIFYRLGLSDPLAQINRSLLDEVAGYMPDIVLIFKGMEIKPDTIRQIAGKGIKVANYNPDNPFIFSGRGSGNINVKRSIPFYHAHISYNHEVVDRFKADGRKCFWLPFGYDVSSELYQRCVQQEELHKCCFVGNADRIRVDFFNEIADLGVAMDIYGGGWSKFSLRKPITVLGPVYDEELWLTLYRYRIQLNILRPHNLDSHGMRSFEIPGAGGIQLTQRTAEHSKFFAEDREALFFSTVAECATKIQLLLDMTPEKAGKIRVAARDRCETSGYSYAERANQLLIYLNDL